MVKIAPSILSADFGILKEELELVEKGGADYIHVDVMDGHFVPNITIRPLVVKACKKYTKLPLDVHLMIENPEKYIPDFAKAGADIITIHAEASKSLDEDLELIRQNNAKPGIVLNPSTPIDSIIPFLDKIFMVLIMSVNPGFEGQKFMPEVLGKIKELKKQIEKTGSSCEIEIDGGINLTTAKEAVRAGATILVAGSAIYYSKDPKETIRLLKNTA